MSVVPVLTSARFLAVHGLLDHGPVRGDRDWAELVEVDASRVEASWAGSYWSGGYAGFLETGDPARLDPYRALTIGGYPLMTDPELIEEFYNAHGHVDFQEYYQS